MRAGSGRMSLIGGRLFSSLAVSVVAEKRQVDFSFRTDIPDQNPGAGVGLHPDALESVVFSFATEDGVTSGLPSEPIAIFDDGVAEAESYFSLFGLQHDPDDFVISNDSIPNPNEFIRVTLQKKIKNPALAKRLARKVRMLKKRVNSL